MGVGNRLRWLLWCAEEDYWSFSDPRRPRQPGRRFLGFLSLREERLLEIHYGQAQAGDRKGRWLMMEILVERRLRCSVYSYRRGLWGNLMLWLSSCLGQGRQTRRQMWVWMYLWDGGSSFQYFDSGRVMRVSKVEDGGAIYPASIEEWKEARTKWKPYGCSKNKDHHTWRPCTSFSRSNKITRLPRGCV